jgi:hypothetical protein
MLTRTGQVLLLSAALLAVDTALADPVSGLLGLLLAEKVGGKHQTVENKPRPWRDNLSSEQLSMLDQLRAHAAIGTCMDMADRGNPVASYQLAKIAALGIQLQHSVDAGNRVPDVQTLAWQRPAKALRWCSRQAGISSAAADAPLTRYAYGIVRLVQAQAVESRMVAAQ